ncbi:hypothetical protein PTKIN_Ptkin18bG0151300 [Pterospermum kingtungense]
MEAVGARLGRSSTRYGPTTVFTGPIRKWKKKWVDVSPYNSASSSNNNNNNHSQNHHSSNGTSNGNNGSHLVLFKWTPISQSQNNINNNGNNTSATDDAAAAAAVAPEEPPRRKFKYIPIAVLEEQKKEAAENIDDEAKPNEAHPSAAEPTSMNDGIGEKPDINDVPMGESQEHNKMVRQDLNESALDLSLG